MKERNYIRFAILFFWTFFWGLSVVDKMIPAVEMNWVGKDFFALFIKFFESIGIKNPIFATIALALIATIETINFVCYLFSVVNFVKGRTDLSEKWLYRAILFSLLLLTFFSVGDDVFGDRSQLLEHALLWMIVLASWVIFRYVAAAEDHAVNLRSSKYLNVVLVAGFMVTAITGWSVIRFSNHTFSNSGLPVAGKEVVAGVYKFDMPFLANKVVFQKTINYFKVQHPDLDVTYIYTAPAELNSKMKTFLLLYLFTKKKDAAK